MKNWRNWIVNGLIVLGAIFLGLVALAVINFSIDSGRATTNPAGVPGPPSSSAAYSVSCSTVAANSYGAGGETVAQVTLTTNDLVEATDTRVTVIDLNAGGGQTGTETFDFNGPLAAGQTFTSQPGTNPAATCEIASVSSDVPVQYTNLTP